MSPPVASFPDNTIATKDIVSEAVGLRKLAYAFHGLILIAAALYWGKLVFLDAPFVYHPDEADVVGRAVRMLLIGDLNPHWFHYPTLLMYLNAAVLKASSFVVNLPLERGLAIGVRGTDPNAFILYVFSRFMIVCFSLGTLFLLLRLASRFANPFMACLAGITFVGSNIVLSSAASVTVDMPATFFVLASLVMLVKFVDSGQCGGAKERYYWIAMILGGLAAGTKYNGAAVLFAAPLACWLAKIPFARSLRLLVLGAALSIAVFLTTTPYALLDLKTFLDPGIGMLYDFRHYSTGHPGADEGMASVKLAKDLIIQHSVLVFCCFLIPVAIIKKDYPKSLLLALFLLILFTAMVSLAKVYFSRNYLVAIPLADCVIAAAVWSLAEAAKLRGKTLSAMIVVVAFLIAGLTASMAVGNTLLGQRRMDSRTAAYEWIMANVPANSRILHEAYCPQLYYSGRFLTGYAWSLSEAPFEEIAGKYDLVITSDTQWKRYMNRRFGTYEQVFKLPLVQEWSFEKTGTRGPAIRIYAIR